MENLVLARPFCGPPGTRVFDLEQLRALLGR